MPNEETEAKEYVEWWITKPDAQKLINALPPVRHIDLLREIRMAYITGQQIQEH